MKILPSIDIHRLEALLVRRVAEHARGAEGPWCEPLLILVTTSRLAQHLKRRILEHRSAALGVHILTHHGVCTRALQHALERPPRTVSPVALDYLLDRLLAATPGDEASYLRRYAGARRTLLTTFRHLRDATVTAVQLKAAALPGPAGSPFVVDLYASFEKRLDDLAERGWSDPAGLTRMAIQHVSEFLARKAIRTIIHYGAYELTGANVRLLETLDDVAAVEFYLPCEIGPPAYRYAEHFVKLLGGRGGASVVDLAAGDEGSASDWIRRLSTLYTDSADVGVPTRGRREVTATQLDWIGETTSRDKDEDIRSGGENHESGRSAAAAITREGPTLELRHTQGAQAELNAAALRALTLHARDGIPWHEIAIVARTLEPYAPFLEHTFEGLGIPYTTSARLPLRRAASVKTFLGLLRVYAGEFERGAVIDLLQGGGLRFEGEPPRAREIDRWDRWSREARVVRQLSEWQELRGFVASLRPRVQDSPASSEEKAAVGDERRRSVEKLLEILDDLGEEARAWRQARSFREHTAVLKTIAHRRLDAFSRGTKESRVATDITARTPRARPTAKRTAT